MNSTNDSSQEELKLSDSEKERVLNEVAESIRVEKEFRAYLKAKKDKQAQSDSWVLTIIEVRVWIDTQQKWVLALYVTNIAFVF